MKRGFRIIFLLLFFSPMLPAQQTGIVSGPMLGPVELRDAKIWLEVSPSVRSVSLRYHKKDGTGKSITIPYKGELGREFNPLHFTIGGLDINTRYQYTVLIDGKLSGAKGEFTTRDLWQWRKPAPDFSFITGSCSYFNQPEYDRPGKPYGGDSSIFLTMAKEKAAFMLWMGDNWYTRDVDFSEWGMWYRPHHDRAMPVLQPLLKAMPHYATWDDHDYGPNDIGSDFILKEESRQIFQQYWCNPSYGFNGQGIYTLLNYADVDIFMTDDRWWRSADDTRDSIDGQPNMEKRMLGKEQMDWLQNALLFSQATFKIILVGSQVLNPVSPYDKMRDFPGDFLPLMKFLEENRISGVLFLTGDRHHSEVIKIDRPGNYPLYDITISPLTSGTHHFSGAEKNNPYRVFGLDEKQNYGRISVSGKTGERVLEVNFLGIKGEELGRWSVSEKALKSTVH
ncbi:MAG: alkaline phosphatase family protein [Terrimonas sp.]|nr:alkaline phosphatase family protein [Terrimonas sp.]